MLRWMLVCLARTTDLATPDIFDLTCIKKMRCVTQTLVVEVFTG